MKKFALVTGIALFVSMAFGGIVPRPAEAAGCKDFGQEAASVAQTGTLGQQASAAAMSGPGVVKAFIQLEMSSFCN